MAACACHTFGLDGSAPEVPELLRQRCPLATSRVGDQRVDIGGGYGQQAMLVRQRHGPPILELALDQEPAPVIVFHQAATPPALARCHSARARRELPLVAAVVIYGQDLGVLLLGEQAVVAGAGHPRDGGGAGVEATHRIGRIHGIYEVAVLHEHDVAG